MRDQARESNSTGPKVMVVGSPDSGKSSLCKLLCNYASRTEEQVNKMITVFFRFFVFVFF